LRFLFSLMSCCFVASSSFRCFSRSSRTSFSLRMRAIIRLCGSAHACSGCAARNSSSLIKGSEVYLCLSAPPASPSPRLIGQWLRVARRFWTGRGGEGRGGDGRELDASSNLAPQVPLLVVEVLQLEVQSVDLLACFARDVFGVACRRDRHPVETLQLLEERIELLLPARALDLGLRLLLGGGGSGLERRYDPVAELPRALSYFEALLESGVFDHDGGGGHGGRVAVVVVVVEEFRDDATM